jgi:hypothetical protein
VSTVAPPNARERLLPMLFGFYPAQVLYTLVRLGIPELLADGPADVDQLGARSGSHPPSLRRLLRAAAGLGLTSATGDRFELTDAGRLLRGSARLGAQPRPAVQRRPGVAVLGPAGRFRALLASAGLACESVTRCAPPVQFSVLRAVPTG